MKLDGRHNSTAVAVSLKFKSENDSNRGSMKSQDKKAV